MRVRVGVEWINNFPLTVSSDPDEPIGDCQHATLMTSDDLALGFYQVMAAWGHEPVFSWGENDAWADDFRHPDFGGHSLNWSDDVHFCYYSSHSGSFPGPDGALDLYIAFASQHQYCLSSSERWRLGSRRLKWFVIDGCETVTDTAAAQLVAEWAPPMQGVHLVLGYIGLNRSGEVTKDRGWRLGQWINFGEPIANAWLDVGYGQWGDIVNRPIAIAAGETREDALNRRDHETLEYRDYAVRSTAWLAWKWRG